ncbi:hypothetical protein PGT21_015148 [Puccinia graminis f. sp. tritici]|uniref:Uncharacterized protein n=1 Tax=Puccinia graminis f. sp. tritici TaxID=56615 RepID=A0A5B0R0M6_PUCGR|nr:hypothetical protein PGT21_026982 [Puccinia graminis f. sp. tritici]KAA1101009.1 hypothetical protein PGT21_004394 [Puccinia graminis f. sp. tritici]KAA1113189.1 hypothetical protein PGT21_024562 [Puccinia graminis f. sp. tritici]KAA1113507.1 hypothetical protein PGT21_032780 [Puccinia graminis f. sp. tritici]KAA1119101.1 hypothetical protein PGT21_015148 [Puccinia graminis f. sp. tritici]
MRLTFLNSHCCKYTLQNGHSEQRLKNIVPLAPALPFGTAIEERRSVALASLMLFRAVVEECPLGLSDADQNGHRRDCSLNDGRLERPSSTRGLGAGMYPVCRSGTRLPANLCNAGMPSGCAAMEAEGALLASSDELIM